jgi:hypothetical protein
MPDGKTPETGVAPRERQDAQPRAAGKKTITQGYPTYAEPDENKGGQNGAPQPSRRTGGKTANAPPLGGADAGSTRNDRGRGG